MGGATMHPRFVRTLCALALSGAFLPAAHAVLFEDGEARRAILELRQRVDELQQASQRAGEDLRIRAAGMDTLLRKPVTTALLRNAIATALAARAPSA